jgi:DNA repair exonuclease SbcCD nuclease subunit
MKFLHAADIHLDSPLAGLMARAEPLRDDLRACTRRAFAAMIDLAIAEDVAFVIIAGDLYDGDWKDFSTGLFFAEQMKRLAPRPCFLLRGNHDAHSIITKRLPAPPNVREFSSRRCETFRLPEFGVALHGHSFPERAVPEDLSKDYPDPLPGMLNIGVLHTSGDDPGEHATYAPCTPQALRDKGYDYWALGHIHLRQVLHERPWIVFPGNLQGRHARETGAKGCTLVTVAEGRITAVEHRSVDCLRWASLAVDATGAEEAALVDRVGAAVTAALAAAEGRALLARLTITGETPLHALLPDRHDDIAAWCANAAIEAEGHLWLEKIKLHTSPPRAVDAGALAPLRAAFLAALEDEALRQDLLSDLAAVRGKVPAPGRAALDLPDDVLALARLADEAWDAVEAAIAQERA